MLTPDRWTRLEMLFTTAVDLPPGEREAFVARAATDHPDLREELSGMLAQASSGSSRIGSVIAEVACRAMPAATWIGRHFGPYRIVREIGRGGMGLVFEAV